MRNVTPEQVAMAEQHRRGELPDRIEGALGELAGAAKEGLMALSGLSTSCRSGSRSPPAGSPSRRPRSSSRERLWASSRPSRPDSPHSSREPERGGAKVARVLRG